MSQFLWGMHKVDNHSGLLQEVHHYLSLSVSQKRQYESVDKSSFHHHTPNNTLELIVRELP